MSNLNVPIDEVVGQHQTVYDVYFSQADSTGSGAIGALDAANFLKQSKVKDTILKDIWEIADPTGKGYLDRQAFYISLKLIALSQSNQEVKIENINSTTPAPKLGELSSNITSLISPDDPWYIKASMRISFDKVFDSLSPINNKISGTRVKPFLLNSGLPVDILGKIWELSDLDQDGQLDRDEFLIAMQLVSKAKEGASVPDQLPPSLLPFKVRHSSISNTQAFIMTSGGVLGAPGSIGAGYPVNLALLNETKPWVVTFEEKTKSDIIFNQTDTDKDGFVTGLEVKDVFLKTGLSAMILANVWALCDIGSTGKLNSEQFALAMHFVNKKLATGLDPPPELSPEMVPPSFRPKPVLNDDSHFSRELEELQTQVTELQREKLFYEQRASEHDTITRQKRTELSNLELEMESLYKTLQEREMKKSEEQKKLADFEDKLVKLDTQLVDLRQKYNSEKEEIERLKMQIQHMESAMKNKDLDLNKIKTDLQTVLNEQANLEAKLNSRKTNLIDLSSTVQSVTNEVSKNKNKIELFKALQLNLNKLIKEYDNPSVTGPSQNELSNEIKILEEENAKLAQQLKTTIETNMAFTTPAAAAAVSLNQNGSLSFNDNNNFLTNLSPSATTSNQFQSNSVVSSSSSNTNKDPFDNFFSPQANTQQANFAVEDPFQTFDPFKEPANTIDPFKSAPIDKVIGSKEFLNDDPFSNAFDAFKNPSFSVSTTNNTSQQQQPSPGFGNDDPFSSSEKKKPPPPRPAPPRPQTPSMKPIKKPSDMSQRPQSALDFTRNNKLDLFNDFSDPFHTASHTTTTTTTTATTNSSVQNQDLFKDPFGNNRLDWNAFGGTSNNKQSTQIPKKDAWDPFS